MFMEILRLKQPLAALPPVAAIATVAYTNRNKPPCGFLLIPRTRLQLLSFPIFLSPVMLTIFSERKIRTHLSGTSLTRGLPTQQGV